MLTLNQIVKRIEKIALQHKQLNNFYFGNVTDYLTDKTTRYASLFLQDNQGAIDIVGKAMSYNFRMYFLDCEDVAHDAKKNTLDVQSDMASVAADLLAEFDFSNYTDWRISSPSTFALVREEFDDIIAGVVVDFTVQVPYEKDVCQIPNR